MENNLIAHLSDIHIRFGSRFEEYQIVFDRTIEDLKQIKPRRILITGDLFHIKITLSPHAIKWAGYFLKRLSEIAPVDIFAGNHDFNSQSPEQGNAITPIIDLLDNGYILTKENKQMLTPSFGNGIYFYKDTDFYHVDKDIIYGVFSCFDNQTLILDKKIKNKKYIATYHGAIFGCRSDNGYQMNNDELIKISTFNNFDIVALGDIHEHQSFHFKDENIDRISYASSLIQQNFSESLDKGYLIWDLNTNTFERRIIPNDYGFCKITISIGEDIEERIRDMQMSAIPKKTKVFINYEDYEENYSIEKLSHIEHLVKKIHGCEKITINPIYIKRQQLTENNEIIKREDDIDYSIAEEFELILTDYLTKKEYDNIENVINLSKEIDKNINLERFKILGSKWELRKMIVNNLFMFPDKDTEFNFDELKGIAGIVGENYCGKTNSVRALIWCLYKKILGGGDSDKLLNLYTKNNKGYAKIFIDINNEEYCIERGITIRKKKDGTSEVGYSINYSKNINGKWVKEDSEEKATEKNETEKVIINALGTFEDFTKVALSAQGGNGGYLTLSQQPKNDLINKYLGLEVFRDRYEYANETFKKVKAIQKSYGDLQQIEKQIEEQKTKVEEENKKLELFKKDKESFNLEIDKINNNKLEEAKKIIKIENLEEKDEKTIDFKTNVEKESKLNEEIIVKELENFLKDNFKKEIPVSNTNLDKKTIEKNLKDNQNIFQQQKQDYKELEEFTKNNKKQEEIDVKQKTINTEPLREEINKINEALTKLNDKLIISKGKKCPTCGTINQTPNPELEKDCLEKIERGKKAIKEKRELLEIQNNKNENLIKQATDIINFNLNYDKKLNKIEEIKNNLISLKLTIDKLKEDLELSTKIEEIKLYNNSIDLKQKQLEQNKNNIVLRDKKIEHLIQQKDLLIKSKEAIENNNKIELKIKELEEDIKSIKIGILQIDDKIKEYISSISVAKNNIENYEEKLKAIKESENIFKKYSIYLQAVHRDGIPSEIIRKKLPIINYRINNLLKDVVDFKIELYIEQNGNIREIFYYGDNKNYALPFEMSSGSQGFLGSVAIQDSLHFVSKLTKPSLCIIDEGFGTLDDKHVSDISTIFSYYKNRYKNTIIITHRNEIKDFVDHVIYVSKTTKGLTEEQLKDNPKAGISVFSF